MSFLLNRRDAGSVLAPKIGQVATLNIPQMADASGGVLRTIMMTDDDDEIAATEGMWVFFEARPLEREWWAYSIGWRCPSSFHRVARRAP